MFYLMVNDIHFLWFIVYGFSCQMRSNIVDLYIDLFCKKIRKKLSILNIYAQRVNAITHTRTCLATSFTMYSIFILFRTPRILRNTLACCSAFQSRTFCDVTARFIHKRRTDKHGVASFPNYARMGMGIEEWDGWIGCRWGGYGCAVQVQGEKHHRPTVTVTARRHRG